MKHEIRQILADQARLDADIGAISDNTNLYKAGMTSHTSINVMLALEDHFKVEFSEPMLRRSVFESINAIAAAISQLRGETAP